jgi:hypothetical protein
MMGLAAATLWAQTDSGELRLSVKDAMGTGLAAKVELANQATSTRQNVDLPADGNYSFKNLPFGFYRLQVSHEGFAPSSELVEVRSAVPLAHDVTLGVQSLSTVVNVTESATLIDPNRTDSAKYIGSEELQNRPSGTPGRGLLDLVVNQPGWTFEANGVLHPRESEYDTQFVVNGFPVYDNRSPAFAPPADADDVESVKAYTSGIPAEYGQKLGGVIEVNTQRNSSPGFHGTAVLQGGSFATMSSFLSGQYVAGKNTLTVTGEGFVTDRYLDPPTSDNFTNHGSNASFTGAFERDLTATDRLRVSFDHRETWFQVPDDLLQQIAGQRQDRKSGANEGQISYQKVFSNGMVGTFGSMIRDVTADLWSNPLSTPISATQNRDYREGYFKAALAGHHGRNEWKVGTEARFAHIEEQFGYNIITYRLDPGNVRIFDRGFPATYAFNGTSPDREQAVFAQDTIRLGDFTVSGGLRFDHYALLVDDSGWSPRASAAYHVKKLGLVLHASYDRTFGTPPFENLLVSGSPATSALNGGFYLPIHPSRGNYYEGGFTQSLGSHVRLDASYFLRKVSNFLDDDLLLNTGVSFPISFHSATIRGTEVKLEIPKWGRFAGYVSYSNTTGVAQYPISGGLFLDDTDPALLASTDHFWVSQDQRNTARAWVHAQVTKRVWTAWTASYSSGLPVEGDNFPPTALLVAQYGQSVLSRVNFDRSRVNPSFTIGASVGADLWKHEKRSVKAQVDVLNLTDRLNVINFAGLLSGTAVAAPRSAGARLRFEF